MSKQPRNLNAGPEAGRGYRRRGACRDSAQVVEFGEVGGEGRILKGPSVEPGVEAAARPGTGPAGVRGEGGLGEAAGGRGRALDGGRSGSGRGSQSP